MADERHRRVDRRARRRGRGRAARAPVRGRGRGPISAPGSSCASTSARASPSFRTMTSLPATSRRSRGTRASTRRGGCCCGGDLDRKPTTVVVKPRLSSRSSIERQRWPRLAAFQHLLPPLRRRRKCVGRALPWPSTRRAAQVDVRSSRSFNSSDHRIVAAAAESTARSSTRRSGGRGRAPTTISSRSAWHRAVAHSTELRRRVAIGSDLLHRVAAARRGIEASCRTLRAGVDFLSW